VDWEASLSREAAAERREPTLEERVGELFRALRDPIHYYLLAAFGDRADAEEITQECFLKLYRVLREGGTVRDTRFWLFRVAHNLAIDRTRSRHASAAADWPEWEAVAEARRDPSPNPEQALLQKERFHSVRAAMQRLTSLEQQALHLRSSGLRYREIAEILNVGTTTVSDALHRAIEKVKAEIHA
jgi:RNA polymerase sigma-70 factor (ECF subfamily)